MLSPRTLDDDLQKLFTSKHAPIRGELRISRVDEDSSSRYALAKSDTGHHTWKNVVYDHRPKREPADERLTPDGILPADASTSCVADCRNDHRLRRGAPRSMAGAVRAS